MRHRKTVDKLGRTAAHRKATLANLSAALFERKHITTTEAKAKATKRVSERLITLAKKETLHARRLALRQLKQKKIVKILFEDIAPRFSDRSGGYTRVIKLGQRSGDGARMAIIELVGFETASKKKKQKEKEKEEKAETRKKRRAKEEVIEEEPVDKEVVEEKKKKVPKKAKKKSEAKDEVTDEKPSEPQANDKKAKKDGEKEKE